MGRLVVFMSVSLDGFVAAAGDGPERGLGLGGEVLHDWLAPGGADPASHRPAGGSDAEVFDEILATGAVVTGRKTFEYAGRWGGDHHDGVPVFVLTRTPPEPATRGHVTYLADVVEAVRRAKTAAGERDVMMHGASSVQAALRAGVVDGFVLTQVPVLLGRGRRLFEEASTPSTRLRLLRSVEGRGVVHHRYAVEGPLDPT